jgi:hypothetical protein
VDISKYTELNKIPVNENKNEHPSNNQGNAILKSNLIFQRKLTPINPNIT